MSYVSFSGMDGAGAHQKIFDSQSVKLSKAGHGLKSCQTFAATLLTCSTAKEVKQVCFADYYVF